MHYFQPVGRQFSGEGGHHPCGSSTHKAFAGDLKSLLDTTVDTDELVSSIIDKAQLGRSMLEYYTFRFSEFCVNVTINSLTYTET